MPKAGNRLHDHAVLRKALVNVFRLRCPNLSDVQRYTNGRARDGQLNAYAQLLINARENSVNMFNATQDIDRLVKARNALNSALIELSGLSVGSERKINSLAPLLNGEAPRLHAEIAYGPFIAWDEPESLSLRYFDHRVAALRSIHDGIDAFLKERPRRVSKNRNYDAAAVAQACLDIWKEETGQKNTARSVNPSNNANNPLNEFLVDALEVLKVKSTAKRALESLSELGGEEIFSPNLEI